MEDEAGKEEENEEEKVLAMTPMSVPVMGRLVVGADGFAGKRVNLVVTLTVETKHVTLIWVAME